MYCRKCGTELPSDGKFCPKCGAETNQQITDSQDRKPSNKKNKIILIVSAICLLFVVIVGSIVGVHYWNENRYSQLLEKADEYISNGDVENAITCWEKAIDLRPKESEEIRDDLNYYRSVKDAEIALKYSDWDLAIEYLTYAIGLKPEISENYLSLATAYVEKWDLYSADKTLAEGYEATNSKDLKNVSIWGPLSLIETAYYMTDYMPITRCEYLFSDNGINSYVYAYGDPIAGASYICENGKVRYITLLDYSEYCEIGLLPQQIQGLPLFDSVRLYFNVEYNENEQMSAVTYAGRTFVAFDYDGDKSATITAKANWGNLFSVGDNIKFNYNDSHLVSEIIYGNTSVGFEYDENGACTATIPSLNSILRFDSAGLLVGLEEPNGADNFEASSDNGRLLSYKKGGVSAVIDYENGKISTFEITQTWEETVRNSVQYFYEEVAGADRLVKMEYTLSDRGNAKLLIYYDDSGRIKRITNEVDSYDMTLSYTNNRLTSYELTGGDLTTTTYVLLYDSVGRLDRKVTS